MPDPRHIHISDYQYDLPDERIAKFPVARRDQSKLLIYNKGVVGEDVFFHLPDYLPKGALMVFNNTKVIQARMHFRKVSILVPSLRCSCSNLLSLPTTNRCSRPQATVPGIVSWEI